MARERRHVLGTTGDVNLFEEDAGVIYSNKYGVSWDSWQQIGEWDPEREGQVLLYEIQVPANVWEYHTWAERKIKSIADTIGMPVQELRDLGMSVNVQDRVQALEAIAGHSGLNELDPSPLTLTRAELKRRWKNIKV